MWQTQKRENDTNFLKRGIIIEYRKQMWTHCFTHDIIIMWLFFEVTDHVKITDWTKQCDFSFTIIKEAFGTALVCHSGRCQAVRALSGIWGHLDSSNSTQIWTHVNCVLYQLNKKHARYKTNHPLHCEITKMCNSFRLKSFVEPGCKDNPFPEHNQNVSRVPATNLKWTFAEVQIVAHPHGLLFSVLRLLLRETTYLFPRQLDTLAWFQNKS